MIKQLREFTAKAKRLSLSLFTISSPKTPLTNECSKCSEERIGLSKQCLEHLASPEPDILLWSLEGRYYARGLTVKGRAQIGPGTPRIRDVEGFVHQFSDDIKLAFDPLYSR